MAKRCSSWWYARKRKRHKETCSSSKQTSGERREDARQEYQHEKGECGGLGRETWRLQRGCVFGEREWSRATCSLNVYMLRTPPMDLHPFMPGIDVARYALLSITAPPFRTGGAKRDAPETISTGWIITYGEY